MSRRPPYKQIVEHYEYITPQIIKRQSERIRGWIYPYCHIDWTSYFTPIEQETWQAIRAFGKCPMYPQYPAQRYFIDFANPYVKVGVECDGKEYHLDKEKDLQRDTNLFKDHWNIYRISGADCYKIVDDYWEVDYMDEREGTEILSKFYSLTIEGLLKAIAIFHFNYSQFNQKFNELELAYKCLKSRISVDTGRLERKYDEILFNCEDSLYDH